MKTRLGFIACALVVLSLVALTIAGAQGGSPIDPYEANEDFAHAYGPLQMAHVYAGYLDNLYDKDFYGFDVDQVTTIDVGLSNVPDNTTYGLILYDKNEDIVDLDVQTPGNKKLSFAMSYSGRYFVMVDVRNQAFDAKRPYLLEVTLGGGSRTEVTPSDPYEDNGTYQDAYGPLESGKTYEAYCWSQDDQDYYYLTVNNPSSVKVGLDQVCADCDYDLYFVDSAGEALASSERGIGYPESLSVDVQPGTYYVVVYPLYSYSQQVPYKLTVTYSDAVAGPVGPQAGNEAAWAKSQIEGMGYNILYEPGVIDFNDGSQAVVAIEMPKSLDLRIEDDVTWRQAVDTWGVLISVFDVDAFWLGLEYQNRYVIYHAISSDNFYRYLHGELARKDIPINSGVWDTQAGEWVSDGRDFINKNFQ